jgi:transglutaminase-like putative cysteine protease
MTPVDPFLRATAVVDWDEPAVLSRAHGLARGQTRPQDVARACFEWVRDEVPHTSDHRLETVTCAASQVLKEGTGFCYAKSHLLAALLRANRIPAGFVYQRLALDDRGTTFCLHGLNAVWLPAIGWYRVDPRGNREGLPAACNPPQETLPFPCVVPGERVFPGVWPDPLPAVVDALQRYRTRAELEANLPDATELGAP